MKYSSYRYLYGPRPENAIPRKDLDFWDNGTLVGQPKMNGTNCLIFTNGIKSHVMNRHHNILTNFKLTQEEIFDTLFRGNHGNWLAINGEYMNKSKMDEKGMVFNHKFVIFDMLVVDGEYMVGKTNTQRIELLDDMYGTKDCEKDYLYKISDNIYRVKSYGDEFLELYDRWTKIDMIEGLVMKRKEARLEIGTSSKNNHKSQLKCRKETKNYKF